MKALKRRLGSSIYVMTQGGKKMKRKVRDTGAAKESMAWHPTVAGRSVRHFDYQFAIDCINDIVGLFSECKQ